MFDVYAISGKDTFTKIAQVRCERKNIKQLKKEQRKKRERKNTSTTQGQKDIQGVLRFNVNVFFGKKCNLVCI